MTTEPLPMTLRVYRALSAAAAPLAGVLSGRRLKQGKEDAARVDERRGVSQRPRPNGPLVWIHGASVGEVLAAAALIERLRALKFGVLITSGTVTSAAIVAKRFPPDVIHQYIPYDAPKFVGRFLDHWHPSLALFIESDLWPNLILSSAARRLPMVLINGRMSPRSFPRWQRASQTIAALLGRFDICLAQSQTDAERFVALGSPNVVVTGNLKLDVQAPPADNARLERLMALTRGRQVVVAASTHPGEEEILIEAHQQLACLDGRMVPDPDFDDATRNFACDLGDVGLDESVLGGDVAATLQPEAERADDDQHGHANQRQSSLPRRHGALLPLPWTRRGPREAEFRAEFVVAPLAGASPPETSVSLTRCSNAKSCLLSRAERSASAVSTVSSATRQIRLCTRSASTVR